MEPRIAIVVDTNVLLASLERVRSVASHGESWRVSLIIPWIVVQELDGMKDNGGPSERTESARRAIDYLHTEFGRNSPAMVGQKVSDTDVLTEDRRKNNDDRVLECAEFFAKRLERRIVIWTYDKNLATKANIAGFLALDGRTRSVEELLRQFQGHAGDYAVGGRMDWEPIANPVSQPMCLEPPTTPKADRGHIVGELNALVEDPSITVIIRVSLGKYIGPEWPCLIDRPAPPWSAQDVLAILDKYWLPVFSNMLPRSSRHLIADCHRFVKRPAGTATLPTKDELAKYARDLDNLFLLLGANKVSRLAQIKTCIDAL